MFLAAIWIEKNEVNTKASGLAMYSKKLIWRSIQYCVHKLDRHEFIVTSADNFHCVAV